MASTEEQTIPLQENVGTTASKLKTNYEVPPNRKTLQTLQYSTFSDKSLTGKDRVINKVKSTEHKKPLIKKLIPRNEAVTVYVDPPKSENKVFDNKAVQTERHKRPSVTEDLDEEAYDLMVNEELSENYWKGIAEQRRVALNDSLHENEMLHKEVEELKDENSKLSKLASQAEYFADVLEECLGVKDESNEEKTVESQNSEESENSEEILCSPLSNETEIEKEKEDENCENPSSVEEATNKDSDSTNKDPETSQTDGTKQCSDAD